MQRNSRWRRHCYVNVKWTRRIWRHMWRGHWLPSDTYLTDSFQQTEKKYSRKASIDRQDGSQQCQDCRHGPGNPKLLLTY